MLVGMYALEVLVLFHMSRYNFTRNVRPHRDITRALFLPLSYIVCLTFLSVVHPVLFEEAYYPLMYLMMFTWSRNMIQIQLCCVTQQQFDPFNIGTLFFVLTSIVASFVHHEWLNAYYWATVGVSLVIFGEFIYSLFSQAQYTANPTVFST